MRNLFLLFVSVLSCVFFAACASKQKSSAHIYEGDAPTIRYAPSEAGGPQSVY